MAWNIVGIVSVREDFQFTSIDVDFMNKQFHRNIVMNDDFGICMAAINYSGMVLASRAQVQNEDDYEDDMTDEALD